MTMDYDSDYIISAINMYTNHDSPQCGRHLGFSLAQELPCRHAVAGVRWQLLACLLSYEYDARGRDDTQGYSCNKMLQKGEIFVMFIKNSVKK